MLEQYKIENNVEQGNSLYSKARALIKVVGKVMGAATAVAGAYVLLSADFHHKSTSAVADPDYDNSKSDDVLGGIWDLAELPGPAPATITQQLRTVGESFASTFQEYAHLTHQAAERVRADRANNHSIEAPLATNYADIDVSERYGVEPIKGLAVKQATEIPASDTPAAITELQINGEKVRRQAYLFTSENDVTDPKFKAAQDLLRVGYSRHGETASNDRADITPSKQRSVVAVFDEQDRIIMTMTYTAGEMPTGEKSFVGEVLVNAGSLDYLAGIDDIDIIREYQQTEEGISTALNTPLRDMFEVERTALCQYDAQGKQAVGISTHADLDIATSLLAAEVAYKSHFNHNTKTGMPPMMVAAMINPIAESFKRGTGAAVTEITPRLKPNILLPEVREIVSEFAMYMMSHKGILAESPLSQQLLALLNDPNLQSDKGKRILLATLFQEYDGIVPVAKPGQDYSSHQNIVTGYYQPTDKYSKSFWEHLRSRVEAN